MGLTILVTGASGFIGQATVHELLKHGHSVIAMVRRAESAKCLPTGVRIVLCDLSEGANEDFENAIGQSDGVIHLAASLRGTWEDHQTSTLGGTRNLMEAIAKSSQKPRVVLVSSMSVYGSGRDLICSVIDETTPLETELNDRDAYCRAKIAQEQIATGYAHQLGLELRIVRPGSVYDKAHIWNAHVGPTIGSAVFCLAKGGEIPMLHVMNCASALRLSIEMPVYAGNSVLNIVDDLLPSRDAYLRALQHTGWPRIIVPVPWQYVNALTTFLSFIPARLPGLLHGPTLRARMMPVEYSNDRIKATLGWKPTLTFEDVIAEMTVEVRDAA